MPKIWVTRSQPGADKTAAKLSGMGYEPFILPLLAIKAVSPLPSLPPDNAVLLITSQNALRIFCTATHLRNWPVMTAGDATAKLAKQLGFEDVISADGSSKDLIDLVQKTMPERNRPFVHVAGKIVRGQVCETLRSSGYKAKRDIYYASEPQSLPQNINVSDVDYVMLYSPLAAQTFSTLSPNIGEAALICISAETQAALGPQLRAKCRIAQRPNETSMFSLLD